MSKYELLRYEMFQRVVEFSSRHQALFPATSAAGEAFAAVANAVAVVDRESATRLVSAQAGKMARAIARQDVWDRLRAIARTARAADRQDPQIRTVFRLPRRKSDLALLTAAKAFIQEGEAASSRWVPLGLPESSVADLVRAVEAFDRALDGRRESKADLTAARESVTRALSSGFDAVRQLDAIVSNTPTLDPVVLAVWEHIRRIRPRGDGERTEPVVAQPAMLALRRAS